MYDRRVIWKDKRLEEPGIATNSSVREDIGVKEMLLYASHGLHADQLAELIAIHIRRLA